MILSLDGRLENLGRTVGPKDEVELVRAAIRNNKWTFAKTYAAFCPHEYTVREHWKDQEAYKQVVRLIWKYGLDAQYGKTIPKRYWFNHEDGYYYFLFPSDVDGNGEPTDGCTIINRGKIKFFEFWIEEDLFGDRRVRCKVRPGAPRRAQEELKREQERSLCR